MALAPSLEKEYSTNERRTASRKAMVDMHDLRQGPPRGWTGLEQFVNWATDHLITKVATIESGTDVDHGYSEQHGEHQYLTHLEQAVTDPASRAHASLHEFLLAIVSELYGMLAMRFGDTDVDKDGKTNAAECDGLCEDIAALPHRFGLVSSWEKEYGTIERCTASCKAMVDMLDPRALLMAGLALSSSSVRPLTT